MVSLVCQDCTMNPYLATLINSELPVEPWLVGVAWLLLLVGAHVVGRKSRLLLRTQDHVVVEESPLLAPSRTPRSVFVQITLAVLLFSLVYYVGEPAFTLIAGGFVAALAMLFGLNLHSLAFARRLCNDDAVSGKVTLPATFVLADIARKALDAAVVFLITGLVFAQLALLAGALILASTGLGYVRKARRHRAQH
jgi:hypothetical protein